MAAGIGVVAELAGLHRGQPRWLGGRQGNSSYQLHRCGDTTPRGRSPRPRRLLRCPPVPPPWEPMSPRLSTLGGREILLHRRESRPRRTPRALSDLSP